MIDLFEINRFVRFLRSDYPEIVVNVKYDYSVFELIVTIYPKKHGVYSTFVGRAKVYATTQANDVINTFFINYLSELSKMGVKL